MAGCDSGLGGSTIVTSNCDSNSLTPEQFINCILNWQQKSASQWANDAISNSSAGICAANSLNLDLSRAETPYEVTAEEPEIPDNIDNVVSNYQDLLNIMLPLFGDTFDDYFNRAQAVLYNPAYQQAAIWLTDVITNGVSGIPVELENQIYGRATDRMRAEAALSRQRGIARSSTLGWKLPNLAIKSAAETEALAVYRGLADTNVRISEKQIDIQIEQVRFAVSEANKVYLGMEANAIDYLSAWTRLLDHARGVAELDPNVEANYINAVSNLYGQRIRKDQVQWMSLNDYHQRVFGDNQLKSNNELTQTDLIVKANASASDVLKMLAAAVLSQLSTIVSSVSAG